jgi:hypothetical protein
MVRPSSADSNSALAPVYVTNVSSVASKFSVKPVHEAVVAAALNPAPTAKPMGTSRFTVGSPAVDESLSWGVGLLIPTALHTPIPQRSTVVLQVTTMLPVVPVGTLTMAKAAQSLLVAVFVTCLTIVADTPPTVIPLRVNPAPAFRAIADTIMYRPAAASPSDLSEKVYWSVSDVSVYVAR